MFDPATLTLVAITDGLRGGLDALVQRAALAARGGATMVQLRLKDADGRTLVEAARRLVAELMVPVVVNDRLDVALAAGAAGVHLGAEDLPAEAARRIAPPGFVIGASVGSDDEVSGARGADYVGIGPVYGSPSKLDAGPAIGVEEFARLARRCELPAVAIGGVGPSNAAPLVAAGAAGIATIGAVFGASDPESAARAIRAAIGR